MNLTGDRRAELLLHGPQSESNAEVSPDGRWLAYQSDESKQDEVYVRPFPNVDSGRWLVSTGGGTRSAWARNGRELFYYQDPGKILAVPVPAGPTFLPGTPQVAVDGRYVAPAANRRYDVSLDGKRFLMIKDAPRRPSQLIVVQNFFEELKRLAPTK